MQLVMMLDSESSSYTMDKYSNLFVLNIYSVILMVSFVYVSSMVYTRLILVKDLKSCV